MTTAIQQPQPWLRWLRWLPLLGGLALVWQVRDTPWTPLAFVRLDGLSAFFLLLTLLAMALAPAPLRRPGPALALLLPAFCLTALLPIALAFLGLALLEPGVRRLASERQAATRRAGLRRAGAQTLEALAPLLAAACLLLGYGALALGGAASYDQRAAGVALGSLSFWFVLLAAVIPLLPLTPVGGGPLALAARLAWLYPLLRLYSLGPWNSGWSLAVLLLGGGAALWAAADALLSPGFEQRAVRARACLLALGLAAFGLSSGAGLAAGCYCLLAALLLQYAPEDSAPPPEPNAPTSEQPATQHSTRNTQHVLSSPWLLTPAVPMAAPFVAIWLVVGAAVAGGVSALAGAAWLAALLLALAPALHPTPPAERRAGGLSLALGVGTPLVLLLVVEPLILQLQGGLTPYGDIAIWPWVGLAALDAARTPVAALPSLAVAGLMLVLAALAYLVGRLRGWAPADGPQSSPPADLLDQLRREVPWLGRTRPAEEERRIDGE